MDNPANLLESRLFRAHWDDGLLDLFAGVAVLGIALSWALDLVPLGAVVPAVLLPLWAPLRRALVEPRAGYVEFSGTRAARSRRQALVGVAIGLALLAATVRLLGASSGDWRTALAPAIPALLLALPAALVAWALGVPRFAAYAAVFVACGAGVALTGREPHVAMFAGAVVVTLAGALRLARFLRLPVDPGDAG